MSKGSGRRPTDHKKYSDNWDKIFNKNKKDKKMPLNLKYTKIGTIRNGHGIGSDEYLLITDDDTITDMDLEEYEEYLTEQHCYKNESFCCEGITLFRKGNSDFELILIVHHDVLS